MRNGWWLVENQVLFSQPVILIRGLEAMGGVGGEIAPA